MRRRGVGAGGAAADAGGTAGKGGMGWPSRTMVTRLMTTGVRGLSFGVAFDACDGGYEQRGVLRRRLAEDGVLAVELGDGLFGDEELAAVGAAAGGAGAGVGHGEEAGLVEGEGWVDLVLEEVAGISGAVTRAVAALDHEVGDDAVKGGAVVEGLVVHLLEGLGVGPVLGAFGETDEVGYGDGSFFFVELAGEAAHGGVDDGSGTGGDDAGLIWLVVLGASGSCWEAELMPAGGGGLSGLRLCGYAEGQNECERTKRHAGFDSNKQAIADAGR